MKNLISDVQDEDGGIDRVAIHSMTGRKISSSTPIEILVQQDFKILINDESYDIIPPKAGKKINPSPVKVKQISVSELSLNSLVLLNIFKKTSNHIWATSAEYINIQMKNKKIDLFQKCFCKFLWAESVMFELLLMIIFTQNMKTKQLKKIKHIKIQRTQPSLQTFAYNLMLNYKNFNEKNIRFMQDLLGTVKYGSVKLTSWLKIFNSKIDYILSKCSEWFLLWTKK